MRWEALFADLEAQLGAARATEAAADVAELTRAERATVELGSRLRAAHGHVLTLRSGAARVTGTVLDVAEQWVLLADGPARWLVPTAGVTAVRGLPLHAAPAPGAVERRLSLGHALRAVARDRATVRVVLDDEELSGRVDRVGADHLDLTVPDPRPGAVWAVPFRAVRAVRTG
ncbi:hypothetical protein [Cellulomonas cellasea]|uniref:Fis family transcriptional regulator n=2 Tax=Cellulomonas cellasea TaxID=43670 RepID=A0A0A0B2X2_9CELL|nr:hypothetical protein [Cellulomonas cellasea]KGM00512.1 hypothetical protein Q760_08235 [Cellulomonas cellasea DSM 20118]GEA88619.1 hypothetical protein CCE01nite_25680 [Cellulomonas cellasea]